ncbi:MFS transporter [Kitasatospora sp. NPDC088783]|uniref:MFS transporter n=1 Tax=Kitasatospora sp. NPDC088783 TaxID=3364077 RepID=UPI00382B8BA8
MNTQAPSLAPRAADQPAAAPARRRQLALLSALIAFDNTEAGIASVMFPMLRTALALPVSALGVLVAVSRIAGMVAGPLWLLALRRVSRRTLLALCAGFWGVWTAAAGLAQDFWQLLLLFAVGAAGIAGAGPLVNGLLVDLFDDRSRGRAAGALYGTAALITALAGPLLGQLTRVHDGWRYGFLASGALQILIGVLVLLFLRDPGVGAAEPRLGRAPAAAPGRAGTRRLLAVPTLRVLLLQRLTNGQFVLQVSGVVLLVDGFGYSNALAATVVLPASLAYLLGTYAGGLLSDRLHRRHPRTGRLVLLQAALLAYGVLAYPASQIAWHHIAVHAALFSVLAFLQGVNPGINRPLVAAVTAPELRNAAFALMLSTELVCTAWTSLALGYLADALGIRAAFLWLLVVLVLANGLLASLFHRTYHRDAAALQAELDRRRAEHR